MGTRSIQFDVDENLQATAQQVLAEEGLTIAQAYSMFLRTVVHDGTMPLVFKTPNEETLAALREAESGNLPSASSVEELMRMLHEED